MSMSDWNWPALSLMFLGFYALGYCYGKYVGKKPHVPHTERMRYAPPPPPQRWLDDRAARQSVIDLKGYDPIDYLKSEEAIKAFVADFKNEPDNLKIQINRIAALARSQLKK